MPQHLRLIHQLLSRRERLQVAILSVAMLLAGVVEMLGVGSVLPFMQLVSDPTVLEGSGWLPTAVEYFGFTSRESATIAVGALLLVVITCNNGLNIIMVWAIASWGLALNHRLSTTLFSRYVHQPYSFFLGRNTATLNRTLLDEVGSVVFGVLIPSVEIAARSVGALFIFGLLAWVDARLSLFMALSLGGAYSLVYLALRPGQKRRGEARFDLNGERFRIAGEALTGIKDVKALGREEEFLRRFEIPSRLFTRAVAHNAVAATVPRYVLETVGMGAIMLMVLGSLGGGQGVGSFLPVLSLYAFGAYRLMPSLNAILRSAVEVRFNAPALEELHRELLGVPEPETSGHERAAQGPDTVASDTSPGLTPAQARIELAALSFRYPETEEDVLRGIDLRIEPRETVGLVGRTGAGKTTLVDLVLGLLSPTEGAVLVDGEPLDAGSEKGWRSRCGYVPQDVFLADDTVTANIAFGVPGGEVDHDAIEAAARVAQIHDFVSGLSSAYETVVGERGVRMSGGQRQRIGIARALYHDPEVLVLDEATSALDGATESAVLETVDALAHRKTILVIAHRLTTVEACDVIHVLEDGRVVASGTYDVLLRSHEGFRAMAGELPR